MGTYEQDRAEYIRRLHKYWTDRQYLDFAETFAKVGPDVAIAELALPTFAAAGMAAGVAAGVLAGFALLPATGPVGIVVAVSIGGAAGQIVGLYFGERFDHWYRYTASTDERKRLRRLGFRVLEGGKVFFGYGKGVRSFLRFLRPAG